MLAINKMQTTINRLNNLADKMNEKLAASGRYERWELDDDGCSNSLGTWFCGTLGGVTLSSQMKKHRPDSSRGLPKKLPDNPTSAGINLPTNARSRRKQSGQALKGSP